MNILYSNSNLRGRNRTLTLSTSILSFESTGTHITEILIQACIFSFKKMHLKMSSAKCQPLFCGLSELCPQEHHLAISSCSPISRWGHQVGWSRHHGDKSYWRQQRKNCMPCVTYCYRSYEWLGLVQKVEIYFSIWPYVCAVIAAL